ncbi:MAG: HAMP domain-containing protein, partial [Clostridiaceae bacterium]|nr:HAMP domain-containing protein [Clostridiaceae bacterium]
MKQSIRTRFTLIFVGLSALTLVAIWCVNNLCLESFYMMDKLRVLERVYERFDQLVLEKAGEGKTLIEDFEDSEDTDADYLGDVALLLKMVAEHYNISIVVSDSVTGDTILPSARDGAFLADKAQRYILGYDMPRTEVLKKAENFTIQKAYDNRSKSFYLESWGYFSDNRTTFIMSTPLASIRESVAVSNRFLAYVGSLAMILSCMVVYLTTRKVTSPILKLASLSEKMSHLDFDAKYEGSAQDEIGVLGKSMNVLSDKLKETIGELKSANLELQKDIEEKIQIDEMRKEFIANVSHELKTPIALIQGYAEGLTEGMCEDRES